jgi:ArsR family transcriptional regulator
MEDKQAHAWGRRMKAFAHPTRLMILRQLLGGTTCVNDMTELLDRPQPNVSQHLMALRKNGLVGFYREGVSRCYYLARPELVRGLFDLLLQEDDRAPETGRSGRTKRKPGRKAKASTGPGS